MLRRAEDSLAYFTFDRIYKVEDPIVQSKIKLLLCEFVDLDYQSYELIKNHGVKSESQGPRSITYESTVNSDTSRDLESEKYNLALRKISNTGLMYRGF